MSDQPFILEYLLPKHTTLIIISNKTTLSQLFYIILLRWLNIEIVISIAINTQ